MRRWRILLALGAWALIACAEQARQEPKDVLRAYANAIESNNVAAAYALMDDAFRKRYTTAEFKEMLGTGAKERAKLVRQLRRVKTVEIHARARYGQEKELRLLTVNGHWRIASDPLAFYEQRTPRQALRSFIRAIAHRRYDIILRFVPNRWASAMTVEKIKKLWEGEKRQEVEVMLKELRANISAPIKVDGSRASMTYAEQKQVRFLHEDGVWKIEDPD